MQENIKHRHASAKDKFVVDKRFVQVYKSIAHTPKYQYQLMQIVLQLDPDVLIEAKKAELQYGLVY